MIVPRLTSIIDESDPGLPGHRAWPLVMRWCRRCAVGPPNFYNSRGLCNVCHKTLRHLYSPMWDSAWGASAWGCTPTGEVGVVANAPCGPRCGPLQKLACACGGPGGIGLSEEQWEKQLGPRAVRSLIIEGSLVPSLEAWEIIPPEITTKVKQLLTSPGAWLADQFGRPHVNRLAGPREVAKDAARVATVMLYRWWRGGPGVPGPGTAFVADGEVVRCVVVSPRAVQSLKLWEQTASIDDLVWDQQAGTDQTPPGLDTVFAPPVIAAVRPALFLRRVAPLRVAAQAVGLTEHGFWTRDRGWELGWKVGEEWLAIYGTVDAPQVEVIWSTGASSSSAMAHLETSPWRSFFSSVVQRTQRVVSPRLPH